MTDMLDLEIGKAYMIKYATHADLKMFLIDSKAVHSKRCHSYHGISSTPKDCPLDGGLYLWDRGVANSSSNRHLSSMGSAIQECRLLTKEERKQFEKELKQKYKFK